MSKRITKEALLSNWTPWQVTRAIFLIIIAIRVEINSELINLLKEIINCLSD